MRLRAKLVAYLLVMAVIALPLAAQMPTPDASPQNSGCDEHAGGTMPSQPAGYICCQAGHATAALQDNFSLPDLVSHFISSSDFDASTLTLSTANVFPVSLVADSPPLLTSLRI